MHQRTFLIAVLIIMLIPGLLFAGTIQLPQTGQTTCSDADGNIISCIGTGQDGNVKAGVPWPNPRFTDNGDETMQDNLTGLSGRRTVTPLGLLPAVRV